ncbi:MAG: Calx-beta domain-containing protein [Pseudomonadota bacterium]
MSVEVEVFRIAIDETNFSSGIEAQETVFLSEPSNKTVEVAYRVTSGTASAESEFAAQAGTLTFAPVELLNTIDINYFGDSITEKDEFILVEVTPGKNASLPGRGSISQAVIWLRDDDGNSNPISMFVSEPSIEEGDSGSKIATFLVELSRPAPRDFEVNYFTSDSPSAIEGRDFVGVNETIFIQKGAISFSIGIKIIGNTKFDGDTRKEFDLTVDPDLAALNSQTVTATILENEEDTSVPNFFDFSDTGFGVLSDAGAADDTNVGSEFADTLIGGSGNDSVEGKGGADRLLGGTGLDTLSGGLGADTIIGGNGNDSVVGGSGGDSLNGSVGNDRIKGLSGNDTLNGDEGRDTLDGGSNNDIIGGGIGNDSILGGDGSDTISGGGDDDTLKGGNQSDDLDGGFGLDVVFGENGSDDLRGGTGKDTVDGGSGNDLVRGDDGADLLFGGSGDDEILGAAGRDTINGGNGDDTLNGGRGRDVFIGGNGDDRYVFKGPFGKDTIEDFDLRNAEKIDLRDVSAIVSFNDLLNNHISDVGKSVVIDDGNGNTITLIGILENQLTNGDFIF